MRLDLAAWEEHHFDEERWQLETQLVRERNRVSDALTDARTLIENTLTHIR